MVFGHRNDASRQNDNGITHWVDGRNVGSLGLSGFLLKKRGAVASTLFALTIAGTPWWWPNGLFEANASSIITRSLFVAGTIAFLIIFLSLLWYSSVRTKRSLALKSGLHQLAHEIREMVCQIAERAPSYECGMSQSDFRHENRHLVEFSNKACSTICQYFQEVVRDDGIICSVRLIYQDPSNDLADTEYVTYGRAGPYNKGRERNSEAVPRSKGLPAYFLKDEQSCQGVVFVHDSSKAVSSKICVLTKNNQKYPEEVRYRAVSPIYGWNGVQMDLLGLLYLTSSKKKLLNRVHVDLYRFTSDILGASYTSIFAMLKFVVVDAGLPVHSNRESEDSGEGVK